MKIGVGPIGERRKKLKRQVNLSVDILVTKNDCTKLIIVLYSHFFVLSNLTKKLLPKYQNLAKDE